MWEIIRSCWHLEVTRKGVDGYGGEGSVWDRLGSNKWGKTAVEMNRG